MNKNPLYNPRTGKIDVSVLNPSIEIYVDVPGHKNVKISNYKNIMSVQKGYEKPIKVYLDFYKKNEYVMLPVRHEGYTKREKFSLDKLYRKSFHVPKGLETKDIFRKALEDGFIRSKTKVIY